MELNDALKQYSNCTQELFPLILLKGECIVYKKNANTTTATSLTAVKHMDDLLKMLKSREEKAFSEGDQKEDCVKLLKICNNEASQVKEKLQQIVNERDILKIHGAKCIDELAACQK